MDVIATYLSLVFLAHGILKLRLVEMSDFTRTGLKF